MPDQPCTDNLDIIVNRMLVQAPHEEFKKYWELYKKTAYISDPKGIYFRISQDATYRNIVIAGGSGIVDIEADENNIDDRDISFSPYRALSTVIIQMGPIRTLPSTQNSLLTVTCLMGPRSMGPYWSAHDEDEVERLSIFAKILVNMVSH